MKRIYVDYADPYKEAQKIDIDCEFVEITIKYRDNKPWYCIKGYKGSDCYFVYFIDIVNKISIYDIDNN